MKIIPLGLLWAACFLPLRAENPLPAQTPPTINRADTDFAALQALGAALWCVDAKQYTRAQFLTIQDQQQRAMRSATLAFYIAHPVDPRRWIFVQEVWGYREFFIKGFKPEVTTVVGDGWETIITDESAKDFWTKQNEAWRQEMLASTDATPTMKEGVEWTLFARDFRATTDAKAKGAPYDYSGFQARFDAHVAKFGELEQLGARALDYLGALDEEIPGASEEIWKHLQDSPSAVIRETVAKRTRLREQATKPVELTFTAADGRAVDLKTLRGKVVLIDFWATWCGPCKQEIPNVKKVYAAYHDRGFEVVGIALENCNLLPKDTPEQTAAKLAKAKKVLTDFTAANAMPWPQYFDGKFWKNDISTQYAIESIPAMFLLDQEGKIVSTNARGEKLQAEVKRLLRQ